MASMRHSLKQARINAFKKKLRKEAKNNFAWLLSEWLIYRIVIHPSTGWYQSKLHNIAMHCRLHLLRIAPLLPSVFISETNYPRPAFICSAYTMNDSHIFESSLLCSCYTRVMWKYKIDIPFCSSIVRSFLFFTSFLNYVLMVVVVVLCVHSLAALHYICTLVRCVNGSFF